MSKLPTTEELLGQIPDKIGPFTIVGKKSGYLPGSIAILCAPTGKGGKSALTGEEDLAIAANVTEEGKIYVSTGVLTPLRKKDLHDGRKLVQRLWWGNMDSVVCSFLLYELPGDKQMTLVTTWACYGLSPDTDEKMIEGYRSITYAMMWRVLQEHMDMYTAFMELWTKR